MLNKIRKKVLLSLIVGGLFYLGFTIYADFHDVLLSFEKFNWLLLIPLLFLSLINYLVRFLKWDYYLSLLKIRIKKIDSLSVFLSGLIMSITPGKVGELLKSFLTKELTGEPVSKTAPIIFAERITDFNALLLISMTGAFIYDYGRSVVLATAVFFIVVIVIISNKKAAYLIFRIIEKNSFIKRHLQKFHSAYESSYIMLKPVPLLAMTFLSIISWLAECLGYYIILVNFDVGISFLWASFSYAFATIAGAISMLPGGLGVTEGSLTFMLIRNGQTKELAVASTFIIRAVTLWFAVLVGIISVSFYQKRFGIISGDNDSTG